MSRQKQPTIEDPDPTLVAQVLEGDEVAHRTFLKRYMPFLRTCLRICLFFETDVDEMEEIEGRALEAVFDTLVKWNRSKGPFAGYVYGIAKMVVLAAWGDRKKQLPARSFSRLKPAEAEPIEVERQPNDDPPGPHMQLLLDAFHIVSDELSPDESVVLQHLLDHVVHKEPHATLARKLNISEASARMRASRLKQKLVREISRQLAVRAA